jgi:hypothetical protein
MAAKKPSWDSVPQLEDLMEKLHIKYGFAKVNLEHPGGGNEGIWVVAVSDQDQKRINSDATNKTAFVRLANMPLGWGDFRWGSLIKIRTNGSYRGIAVLSDQTDAAIVADLRHLKEVLTAYYRKKEEEKKKAAEPKPKEVTSRSRSGGKRKHG